jgi:hypothetical protein
MPKKYIKNKYQIMCFLLSMLLFLFISLYLVFLEYFDAALIVFFVYLIIIFTSLILGFYVVFQFVSFDKNGINIYLFKKKIKHFEWSNIVEINESYIYRGPVYQIVLKNNQKLNLDRRKKIKQEIEKYYDKKINKINKQK